MQQSEQRGADIRMDLLFLWVMFAGDWSRRIHGVRDFYEQIVVAEGLWVPLLLFMGHGLAALYAVTRLALSRRYAQVRHDQGLVAPDDALPLLARAAPALAALPPGSVKRAVYADGHWTLDLALTNPSAIGDLEARMHSVGVPALMAPSANGVRVRVGGS